MNIRGNTFTKVVGVTATAAALWTVTPVFADSAQPTESKIENMSDGAQRYFKNGWQEGQIETAILFNENLNNFEIDAEVNDGHAVLVGTVSSGIEKDLAEQITQSVDGITEVDNQLQVQADAGKETTESSESTFMNSVEDASLTAQVKMKLLANDYIKGLDIDVDTQQKVVTLKGQVQTTAERDLAEKIVENVDAVTSVKNELEVVNS